MKLKRVLIWLFPVYLLSVQHGGLAHGLSHSFDPDTTQERSAATDVCTKCVSFTKLAHLAVSTGLQTLDSLVGVGEVIDALPHHRPAGFVVHRNRGPPELL